MLHSTVSDKNIALSIIIINYNLAEEIENCINSFLENNILIEGGYEIIVVDNNSPDKKLPGIENKFHQENIYFYYLNENLGFGKGCNYGFSKSSGKYICFLNPDTIIVEDIFTSIINLFDIDKSIGIIAPKQQVKAPFFDFSAGYFPNIIFELFNLVGVGVFFDGFITYLKTKLNKGKSMEVDWILGAAIFIPSDLFNKINGFDKDYFMFFEEVDLCKKVSEEGLKIMYCPHFHIHHIGSVSGKKDYRLYTIRTYSSKNIFISKHYSGINKFLMKFLIYLSSISQLLIWTLLYPFNSIKSKQKLSAFKFLLLNNMHLS